MQIKTSNSGWIVALIMFGLLMVQRACDNSPAPISKNDSTVVTRVDTFYLPAPPPVIKKIPVPVEVPGPVQYVPVQGKIDTAAIVKNYLRSKVYHRTLANDSVLFASLTDTVVHNSLTASTFTYRLKRGPMVIKENTTVTLTAKPTRKLFAGLAISGNGTQFGFGPDVIYMNKKEQTFGAGYDAVNGIASLRTHWKISFKRATK